MRIPGPTGEESGRWASWSEQHKWDALAACEAFGHALAVREPVRSPASEAWSSGKPVLVNARLRGAGRTVPGGARAASGIATPDEFCGRGSNCYWATLLCGAGSARRGSGSSRRTTLAPHHGRVLASWSRGSAVDRRGPEIPALPRPKPERAAGAGREGWPREGNAGPRRARCAAMTVRRQCTILDEHVRQRRQLPASASR